MLLLRYHFPAALQHRASNFIPGEARKGGDYVHHHQQQGPSHPCHGELPPASISTTHAVNERLQNLASLLRLALSHAQLCSEHREQQGFGWGGKLSGSLLVLPRVFCTVWVVPSCVPQHGSKSSKTRSEWLCLLGITTAWPPLSADRAT